MNAGRSDLSIFEYTGEGASHSWLWLADSMERLGVTGLRFGDFGRGIPDADMIVISGGDFGKMTRAIGDANFASLQSFVRNGGTYLGLCSGAYLPLRSSRSASWAFHSIDAPISNIADPEELGSLQPRYRFRCGDREVFQPASGPVRLDIVDREIVAPMFAGPIWKEPPDGLALATYRGLEKRAKRYVSRELFDKTVKGKTAAVSTNLGAGRILLFGPHPEHPDYHEANAWLLKLLPEGRGKRIDERLELVEPPEATSRALSLAKTALTALEGKEWTVGEKVWDTTKATHYVDSMLKRLPFLERSDAGVPGEVTAQLANALNAMRSLQTDPSNDSEAEMMFICLSRAASAFLNHYFVILRRRSGKATK